MNKRSKRYKEIFKSAVKGKKISTKEILDLVKKNSTTKFDESIDVSLRINLKQSKGGDLSLRTTVKLPNGSGKKTKVAVLCETDKVDEAKKAGAELCASESLINDITAGKINFDKLISTPSMMSKMGKLGKILGPKGLMPNPKLGTVTNDVGIAVKALKSGQVEIRNDKDGNLGVSIGKKSFNDNKIKENYNILLQTVAKEKPNTIKGEFILSAYLTSSMGTSYKLKLGK